MVSNMKIKCYAVFDAKIKDFHLCVFDIEHEGAMRQFTDNVNDKQTKWNRHPEDYSLWYVGVFDTSKGLMEGVLPESLVNAAAVVAITTPQLDLFKNNNEEKKEPVIN